MKFSIIFLVIFTGFYSTLSAQTTWQVQPTSAITFKIKNAGLNVKGSLGELKASIKFSPDKLSASTMQASVQVKTIDTGIKARDKHLKKPDYFDVEKHPQITMKSKRFARSKSGDFIGYFMLSIKGVEKEIKIPFKFSEKEEISYLEGSFKINRRDFGVGSGSLILSNQVEVQLKIAVKK